MSYVIHEGDCFKLLCKMKAKSIDSVIVDPPFYGFDLVAETPEDYWKKLERYYNEMVRVCKNDKRLAISASTGCREYIFPKVKATSVIQLENCFTDERGIGASFMARNPVLDVDKPQNFEQLSAEKWPLDIVSASRHPNSRDVNKMSVVVKAMTNEGDTVLDPFCGSGSIGIACVLLGRNYVGMELIPERAAEARIRLEEAEKVFESMS